MPAPIPTAESLMPFPQLLATIGRRLCGDAARRFDDLARNCPPELRAEAEDLAKLAQWTELRALDWERRYVSANLTATAAVMPQ